MCFKYDFDFPFILDGQFTSLKNPNIVAGRTELVRMPYFAHPCAR
jgi:hypothetical protein